MHERYYVELAKQEKLLSRKNEKTRALMEYKLEELTKRVDKHNNTIERTYNLEQRMAVSEEQIRVANHRIADLEHDHKED